MLIIKHAVELVATDLASAIGAPEDYNKNLEKGRFPDNTDITIPSDKRQSSAPIEDKMDNINLSEKKPAHVAPDHFPESDQYMPIKCLNQFSSDWKFKARVVKKPPLRNYKNARGEGKIMSIDLIDREGTMI